MASRNRKKLAELRRVLDEQPDTELPNLRRVLDRYLEHGPDPRDAFERELDLVVAALDELRGPG